MQQALELLPLQFVCLLSKLSYGRNGLTVTEFRHELVGFFLNDVECFGQFFLSGGSILVALGLKVVNAV